MKSSVLAQFNKQSSSRPYGRELLLLVKEDKALFDSPHVSIQGHSHPPD